MDYEVINKKYNWVKPKGRVDDYYDKGIPEGFFPRFDYLSFDEKIAYFDGSIRGYLFNGFMISARDTIQYLIEIRTEKIFKDHCS